MLPSVSLPWLALTGCLDHDLAPGADGSFVAMQIDFAGYSSWEAFDVDAGDAEDDTGGHSGDRTVYINLLPEDGSSGASRAEFAVGTILIKVAQPDAADDTGPDVHAMVKRGGGYNSDAPGWEWFDLVLSGGIPVINWRGLAPPAGGGYQAGSLDTANPDGDCNSCHGAAYDNDYVHTVPL